MTIKVEISEADVVRVLPGQKVFFTILGEPDSRYPAVLKSIEPAPESIASESSSNSSSSSSTSSSSAAIFYMGILDVPNTDGKLRISMTTQVNIILAEAGNVLVIPSAALGNRDKNGLYTVRVETGPDKIEEHRVKIGLNNNVQAEVQEGLREGQRVIIGEQIAGSGATGATQQRRPQMPPRMF